MPSRSLPPLLALAGAFALSLVGAATADARPPRGYVVRESGTVVVPPGAQQRGELACPGRKVPLGGGAIMASLSPLANVNSSFPSPNGWVTDFANASASPVNA